MRVYLDHNATTALRPEARACFLRELDALGGNPSSVHAAGRRARARIDEARERAAAALGVSEEGLIFTSGGTEANNTALFGVLRPRGPRAGLVTSTIEHSSVLAAAEVLERAGHPVRRLAVDARGRLDEEALEAALAAPETGLVSLMAANNEVGSVFPLERIGARVTEIPEARRPRLHVDAVQAVGRVELDLAAWGIDLISVSAHKLGGPLGVGVLSRRPGVALEPLLFGGGQEGGLRPGTENAPAIAAAALAIELAVNERQGYAQRTRALTDALWRGIAAAIPDARLVGPALDELARLPNTLNVLLSGVDGRALVARLDLEGLEASAGSACASGSLEPSHVLMAMGYEREAARAALRLSLGRETTDEDVSAAVETLRKVVESMRTTA